jgi:hypothetical protein
MEPIIPFQKRYENAWIVKIKSYNIIVIQVQDMVYTVTFSTSGLYTPNLTAQGKPFILAYICYFVIATCSKWQLKHIGLWFHGVIYK